MRWYNPDNKSVVFVYDISNPSKPILIHSAEVDGYYKDSRLIGNTLYFLSQSDFRIAPYYVNFYARSVKKNTEMLSGFDKNFSLNTIVPQIRESIQNPNNPTKYFTTLRSGITQCKNLSFVLPDTKTLKNISINPTFTTIASLDIASAGTKVQTSIVFGDASQIYMSQKNLYLVSNISQNTNSPCPLNAKCIAPSISSSSTLIHRFSLVA